MNAPNPAFTKLSTTVRAALLVVRLAVGGIGDNVGALAPGPGDRERVPRVHSPPEAPACLK